MPTTESGEGKLKRVAVVVTHGVGEAEPGQCTGTLVRALGREPGVAVEQAAEVLLLPDDKDPTKTSDAEGQQSHADEQTAPTFPVLVRHATVQNHARLTLAELHWADLTRVGTGRIASVLGLFRVIFEAHYIIDAMLAPRWGWAVRGLRFVLLWLSWLMRGPIAGISVATIAVFWATLYARPDGLFRSWSLQFLFAGVLAVTFVLALGLRIWSDTRWDATWRTSLNWTLFFCAAFSAILLTAPSPIARTLYQPVHYAFSLWPQLSVLGWRPEVLQVPDFVQRADFVNVLYLNFRRLWILFALVWVLGGLSLLSVIGLYAWGRKLRRPLFAPALAATGILTLQLALWTALVGTAVLPILNRAQEIIAITALRAAVMNDAKSRENQNVKQLLDVADLPKEQLDWVERIIFAYGYNGLIVLSVIIVGFCVYLIRERIAARSTGASPEKLAVTAQRLPRLVLSWPLLAILIGLTLVQVTFHIIFAAETSQLLASKAGEDTLVGRVASLLDAAAGTDTVARLKEFFSTYLNVIMTGAWISALLFPALMGKSFNNAVHVARDLIDHQYGPHRGRVLAQRRDRRMSDAERWPRRERIRRRLLQVLDALAKRGNYDKIVFLAHSQGSVVVYDYLRSTADSPGSTIAGTKPDVITFGSPLGHLYQHYFREYAGLGSSLEQLSKRTGRWINLYRIDDWIGVWVGDIDGKRVENFAMQPGGHIDYWKEKTLAQAILQIVMEEPAHQPAA